jgi:type VI secretion system secreted protein Hcp
MKALRTNEEIKEAVLTVRKVGKNPLEYLTIKIEGGRIIALDIDTGESSNPVLIERVSFSFNKISIVYTPQGQDGHPLGKTVFEDEWTPQA